MNFYNITEVIISPFHRFNIFAWKGNMEKDDRHNDIYKEAMELLKKNSIRKNSQAGIRFKIEGNREIIEIVLEGAYRYVLELCLFFPDKSIIIEPTHHFDLTFFTKDFEEQRSVIKQLLSKNVNIRYYEYTKEEFI